jgi:hypothetical protein
LEAAYPVPLLKVDTAPWWNPSLLKEGIEHEEQRKRASKSPSLRRSGA